MYAVKKRAPINPTRMITASFLAVILTGTLLLCLPISSKAREFTSLLDCLFTATSATCVTGLIVYDTYTHWSLFGQGVIMALIQVGGLGLVTFTSFFSLVTGKKLGLRGMKLASESGQLQLVKRGAGPAADDHHLHPDGRGHRRGAAGDLLCAGIRDDGRLHLGVLAVSASATRALTIWDSWASTPR